MLFVSKSPPLANDGFRAFREKRVKVKAPVLDPIKLQELV